MAKNETMNPEAARALADALKAVDARSARFYRIAGFWCFRVVDEHGRVRLGTAYKPEDAITAAFDAVPVSTATNEQRRAS